MPATATLLSAALGATPFSEFTRLTPAEWEARLALWEQPASDSEEETIERAARMVRDALATNPWFARERVITAAQGSYFNNTNVRRQSDMDIRVVHPAIVTLRSQSIAGTGITEANFDYTDLPWTNGQIAAELRRQVELTLNRYFGAGSVNPGKKALRLPAVPGSRAPIDVVPALNHHFICHLEPETPGAQPKIGPVQGVYIIGTDGSEIRNYPEHHHRHGKAKRDRTGHRFKKIVRTVKSLRDELVEAGLIGSKELPSFLIECLVYLVEDDFFIQNETRLPRLRRILTRLDTLLADANWVTTAVEINHAKPLFYPAQPWNIEAVRACVKICIMRLGV